MKNLKVLAVVLFVIIGGSANSQMKVGYISITDMVSLMPETAKIDTLLNKYQTDSLQPEYSYTLSEYLRKDSMVNGSDSEKVPPTVRATVREELQELGYKLQNWQAYAQQLTENKQQVLLAPIYRKVIDAIKQVAKEKGYTHVFNKESFIVAPEGDDMILLVAEKLKVKLPPQLQQGIGNKTGSN
jgi:outer membrane protein